MISPFITPMVPARAKFTPRVSPSPVRPVRAESARKWVWHLSQKLNSGQAVKLHNCVTMRRGAQWHIGVSHNGREEKKMCNRRDGAVNYQLAIEVENQKISRRSRALNWQEGAYELCLFKPRHEIILGFIHLLSFFTTSLWKSDSWQTEVDKSICVLYLSRRIDTCTKRNTLTQLLSPCKSMKAQVLE